MICSISLHFYPAQKALKFKKDLCLHGKKTMVTKCSKIIDKGGGSGVGGRPFQGGVRPEVDEKWTGGEGGSKKAKNRWTSIVQAPLALFAINKLWSRMQV